MAQCDKKKRPNINVFFNYYILEKMASRTDVLLCVVIILSVFYVKKISYVSSDCIGLTMNAPYSVVPANESFIMSSLWNFRRLRKFVRRSLVSYLCLLIFLCGDIETCPGPLQSYRIPELDSLLQQTGMSILHQNVRGLFSNKVYIENLIENYKNIDIFTLSETHIDKKSASSDIYEIPGYTFYNQPRAKGKGGGVGAYVSDKIPCERRFDLEKIKLECIWLEIMPEKAKNFL